VLWQSLAGGLAAAGSLVGGVCSGQLRQFDGSSGIMCFYAAVWLIAGFVSESVYDFYSVNFQRWVYAGTLQAAALSGFLVLTLILAVRAFRQREPRRRTYIVQFAALGLMILFTLWLLCRYIYWFIVLQDMLIELG
jgi:hypothetical protein